MVIMNERIDHPNGSRATDGGDLGWLVPSPGLWKLRQTEVATVTVPVAGLVGTSFGIKHGIGDGVTSALVVVALGVVLAWFVHRRFRAWRYQERHEDLVVGRGVMIQRLSVVPYGRMQFVELTAGPFERMFKLSTVKLHTAAAASDARIPGLARTEAVRLRDRLTELGESKAAGL
jgi:membrane protein YdbS with pleckstrin-like domain